MEENAATWHMSKNSLHTHIRFYKICDTRVVEVDEELKLAFKALTSVREFHVSPPFQLPFSSGELASCNPTSLRNGTGVCLATDQQSLSMLNMEDQKLFTADIYTNSRLQFKESCLQLNDQDYILKIKEFHEKLDEVKNIVRPGCSLEVLNTALTYFSSLAGILSAKPSKLKLHASL